MQENNIDKDNIINKIEININSLYIAANNSYFECDKGIVKSSMLIFIVNSVV